MNRRAAWCSAIVSGCALAGLLAAEPYSPPATESADRTGTVLDQWAAASRNAPPMTPAERRRFVLAWRERLSGHEIDVLAMLQGPVSRRLLAERFAWACAEGADGAVTLTAAPRDPVERLFVRRMEISLDPDAGCPTAVRFFDRTGQMRPVVALEPRSTPSLLATPATAIASANPSDESPYDEPVAGTIQTVAADSDEDGPAVIRPATAELERTPPRRLDVGPAKVLGRSQSAAQSDTGESAQAAHATRVLSAWQKASAHIRHYSARCLVDGPDPFDSPDAAKPRRISFGVFASPQLPAEVEWAPQWLGPIHAADVLRRFNVSVEDVDDEGIVVTLMGRSNPETVLVTLSKQTMLPVGIGRHEALSGGRVAVTLIETRINGPSLETAVEERAERAPRPTPVVARPPDDQNDRKSRPNPPLELRGVVDDE